jgi:hypothetical protein
MLLNSILAEPAAQGSHAQTRRQPVEGITSRPRHCWVVFCQD